MSNSKSKMGSLGFVFPMIGIGKAHLHLLHLILLSASFLMSPTSCAVLPDNSTALFFFGDGIYDTGNWGRIQTDTNFNHPPYGITHFHVPTGRPSDGHLIVDYIAENVMQTPHTITPYGAQIRSMWRYGVSFATIGASAGSTNESLVFSGQIESFQHVCDYLETTYGGDKSRRLLSKSVYIFSLGTVDFSDFGPLSYRKMAEIAEVVFSSYKEAIQSIYAKGGRKFAFQNLGPLELTPYYKNKYRDTKQCDILYSATPLFNQLLKYKLSQWATCESNGSPWLKDIRISYFDYYSFVLATLNDKSLNVTTDKACCGSGLYNGEMTCGDITEEDKFNLCHNPDTYLWFDALHPTDAASRRFAQAFWSNKEYVQPYTLEQLYHDEHPDPTPYLA